MARSFTLADAIRAQALATGRKPRVKRPTVAPFPLAAERGYTAAILRIVRAAADDIKELLLPQLETLVRMAGTRTDSVDHADQSDVSVLLNTIEGQLQVRLDNTRLRNLTELVDEYGTEISQAGRFALIRQIRRMVGIDAMVPEPQLEMMLETWREEGQRLITKMTREQIDDTMNIARRGIRAGDRPSLIAERVIKKTGITENKARLIARDQTNKLHGQLTKMRQENLGIESYIWRTSLDERVRASHLAKEGKEFRWDDPPPDTGHPGEDINCRCTSAPVLEGMPKAPITAQAEAKLERLKREQREREAAKKKRK